MDIDSFMKSEYYKREESTLSNLLCCFLNTEKIHEKFIEEYSEDSEDIEEYNKEDKKEEFTNKQL